MNVYDEGFFVHTGMVEFWLLVSAFCIIGVVWVEWWKR